MTLKVKIVFVCAFAFLALSGSSTRDATTELVVIYTGDSGGEVESCGCSDLAYGGLARRASLVNVIRANYPAAVFVDAGDFFSPNVGEQDRLKNEITAEAYGAFAYDAVNLGEDEFNFGADFLENLVDAYGIPVISANISAKNDKRAAPPFKLISRGDVNVGVVGFLNPEVVASKGLGGATVKPYKKLLADVTRALAAEADVIICLAHVGNVEKARAFAARCPEEMDVVIAGHRGGRTPQAENVKGRWMVYTRSRNRYVGMLKLTLDDLRKVVAAENHLLPVTKDTAKDEATQALVEKYYAELRELVEEKKLLKSPEEVPPGGFIYVGSSGCAGCHPLQTKRWRNTAHATAYESLAAAKREMDPECIACHVTGYGFRGGFLSAARTRDRLGVGCEECHGAGEGHAQTPAIKTRPIAAATCTRCHDEERSPAFDYAEYSSAVKH